MEIYWLRLNDGMNAGDGWTCLFFSYICVFLSVSVFTYFASLFLLSLLSHLVINSPTFFQIWFLCWSKCKYKAAVVYVAFRVA